MITFKAIVIPNNRRKDGTYPVKIRVTFKGVTRRLPTTMVCTASDLTRSLKIKNADILNKSDELIGQMRKVAMGLSPFDLENHDVDWVVDRIKQVLKGESFRLDFFEWADRAIEEKAETTRKSYITALNSFEMFLGTRSIDINDITRTLLLQYVEWCNKQPKMTYCPKTGSFKPSSKARINNRQASVNCIMLAHIFEKARDRYNDEDTGKILIPRQPFSKIEKTIPPSRGGQKNLGRDLMQRIISYETDDPVMRIALDVFIVSFGMMGSNMADLYGAEPFRSDTWEYNRSKTKNRRKDKSEMRVDLPEELLPHVARLRGKGPWWLNELHHLKSNKDDCTRKVNECLTKWCEANEVARFTFYAARHTWASLARKAGVEKATIDECLAHKGMFDMADIYAERDWEGMQKANRKVLDMFQWKRED